MDIILFIFNYNYVRLFKGLKHCTEDQQPELIQLNLSGDTGFTIANSVDELYQSVQETITSNDVVSKINDIEYLYYGDYTYAIVTFTTTAGATGNVIYGNSPFGKSDESISSSRMEDNCWRGTCSGTCGCLVSVTPPAIEGQQPTFHCSCTECTLTLETCED